MHFTFAPIIRVNISASGIAMLILALKMFLGAP